MEKVLLHSTSHRIHDSYCGLPPISIVFGRPFLVGFYPILIFPLFHVFCSHCIRSRGHTNFSSCLTGDFARLDCSTTSVKVVWHTLKRMVPTQSRFLHIQSSLILDQLLVLEHLWLEVNSHQTFQLFWRDHVTSGKYGKLFYLAKLRQIPTFSSDCCVLIEFH